tara:strand:+ start:345 stop:539 length:195 start_codon:yes stop_codon:yes gene_type:complete
MAVDRTSYGIDFKAPVLPDPPMEYDESTFNQINNALRLYFNQLDKGIRDASMSPAAQATSWFLS